MFPRISRRLFLGQLALLAACSAKTGVIKGDKLTVGLVSYDQGQEILDRYKAFKELLAKKIGAIVQLEPAFNENKALERIQSQEWSIVFAPPGLAAIAISKHQYKPTFTLEGIRNLRAVLITRQDNSVQSLKDLAGKTVALGQVGSATGFYLPLYNLYGLTLAEILFAPTPKAVLEAVVQGKATAGALSQEEFNAYSKEQPSVLRSLFTDEHSVPPGAVLLSPNLEQAQQEQIRQAMNEATSDLSHAAGYILNQPAPDYQYMVSVVERVTSISKNIYQKPAALF